MHMTLEEAKLCLRVDQDFDDDRIRGLISAAQAYIAETTGLSQNLQDAEPLCNVAMEFLLKSWYGEEINFYTDRTLESVLKTIKAKYTETGTGDEKQSESGA